jgi:hypothetical protein
LIQQQNSGPNPTNSKPPLAASLSIADSPITPSEQELAAEIFGENSKPPAIPYNSAARAPPNSNNRFYASLMEAEALDNVKKATLSDQHPGITFQHTLAPHTQGDQTSAMNQLSPGKDTEMQIDSELNPVEKLNQLIAQQQAQLEKLQNAFAALKALPLPRITQDIMELSKDVDDQFTTVVAHGQKKKIPPPKKFSVKISKTQV